MPVFVEVQDREETIKPQGSDSTAGKLSQLGRGKVTSPPCSQEGLPGGNDNPGQTCKASRSEPGELKGKWAWHRGSA